MRDIDRSQPHHRVTIPTLRKLSRSRFIASIWSKYYVTSDGKTKIGLTADELRGGSTRYALPGIDRARYLELFDTIRAVAKARMAPKSATRSAAAKTAGGN